MKESLKALAKKYHVRYIEETPLNFGGLEEIHMDVSILLINRGKPCANYILVCFQNAQLTVPATEESLDVCASWFAATKKLHSVAS